MFGVTFVTEQSFQAMKQHQTKEKNNIDTSVMEERPANDNGQEKKSSTEKKEDGDHSTIPPSDTLADSTPAPVVSTESKEDEPLAQIQKTSPTEETNHQTNQSTTENTPDNPQQSPTVVGSEPAAVSFASHAKEVCQSIVSQPGMEEGEAQSISKFVLSLVSDLEKGKIGNRNIKSLLRMLHYDRDVAQADRDGEIRGRNARIEELLSERSRLGNIHMPVGSHQSLRPAPPSDVIGGLAAADRKNIWERGNEKRTVY